MDASLLETIAGLVEDMRKRIYKMILTNKMNLRKHKCKEVSGWKSSRAKNDPEGTVDFEVHAR